jgi:ZIP family zinc transporter
MNPIGATVFGFSFIFLMTSLGSAIVFFFHKQMHTAVRAGVFAFAGGVMLSASFWGLLETSYDEASAQDWPTHLKWVPTVVGFILGCLFLFALDVAVPLCIKQEDQDAMSVPLLESTDPEARKKDRLARAFKLFLAITIHNIPEGVACGLAFGIALNTPADRQKAALAAAIGLSIGIGIQDIPEGAAVSLPIREIGASTVRGFTHGVLSGLVEPIGASLALAVATFFKAIDPWALAFSGGAMVYVTVEELIPDAMDAGWNKLSMWMFVLGFVLMMFGELYSRE